MPSMTIPSNTLTAASGSAVNISFYFASTNPGNGTAYIFVTEGNNNRTLNLNKKDNFAIELHYYRVENTNPSVIRLKDANINVTFTYLDKPSIDISQDKGIINCSSKN